MADMFDYLKWRGDIPFSKMPPNSVDSLILSTLSYISYDGIVSDDVYRWSLLKNVAKEFLEKSEKESLVRVKKDIELITAVANTVRFGNIGMSFYKNVLIPEEDTQFSAVSFFLDDGSAFLVYRGTDKSLTGWKEDFNMSFLDSIPAQRMALQYLQEFCESIAPDEKLLSSSEESALDAGHVIKRTMIPIRLGGHSKGGNLAVYAAVKCGAALQENIFEIYNHDGPGFTENLMGDTAYINLVPKIKTYVPQSSLIGMLLEHEEPYTVIKSNSIGVLQHDPYTWEVMGASFIQMEELTSDARFLDKTIKTWMNSMTPEERDQFVESVFEILETGGADSTDDLIKPKHLIAYFKMIHTDDERRKILAREVAKLVKATGVDVTGAKNRLKELTDIKNIKESIKKRFLKHKLESEKSQDDSQDKLQMQEYEDVL